MKAAGRGIIRGCLIDFGIIPIRRKNKQKQMSFMNLP